MLNLTAELTERNIDTAGQLTTDTSHLPLHGLVEGDEILGEDMGGGEGYFAGGIHS